jgi:hypothetical protein
MAPNNEENPDDMVEETVEEPRPTEEGKKTELSLAGFSVSLDSNHVPYYGQFFAAMVVLIAICVQDGDFTKNYEYGISVGAIGMFFSLVGLFLIMDEPIYKKNLFNAPYLGEITLGRLIDIFNFVWFFLAAFILTFNGPFRTTENGYFASWAALFFATSALGVSTQVAEASKDTGALLSLGVASFIVICATPDPIKADYYRSEAIYALVVACLTLVVVIGYSYVARTSDKAKLPFEFPVMAISSILWIVAASLVTFNGPFVTTGNGYFGSWGGAIFSLFAVGNARATTKGQIEETPE